MLFLGVAQAQTLTCDRGTRGGTADRRTVTFACTGTIPRGSSATTTPNWSRFLLPASRFSSARLTVNSPTPGETRVKVAGTFQGTNGNNIKTCQTRRGLILPGSGAAGPDTDLTAGAAATIMYDGYKGDEDHKRSHEYKDDEDSDSSEKIKPFKGVDLVFTPVVVAPDAPPAPKKKDGDKYEEDEDEYAYNEEDTEYYNVKFDDWEDASIEQDASPANFGNDIRQCRPRVSRGNAQASIAAVAPQQKGRLPETPAALRLEVHCKQAPQGQQNCVVRARLVVAFTGDLANVAK